MKAWWGVPGPLVVVAGGSSKGSETEDDRLYWSWQVHIWQVLHRRARVVDVEEQWISWKAGAEGMLCSRFRWTNHGGNVRTRTNGGRGAHITGSRVRRTIYLWGDLETSDDDRWNFGGGI